MPVVAVGIDSGTYRLRGDKADVSAVKGKPIEAGYVAHRLGRFLHVDLEDRMAVAELTLDLCFGLRSRAVRRWPFQACAA
jgi:hypothetical protein